MAKSKSAGTPATAVLERAGVRFTLHSYEPGDPGPGYGAHAAAALGVSEATIFKTLVCDTGSGLVVGVVPVAGQLDLKAMATAVGVKKLQLADTAAAERSTGYVVGGISPLGQRNRLPTVIDASARELATLLVSAGRRGLQVELAPQGLIDVLDATVAAIAR